MKKSLFVGLLGISIVFLGGCGSNSSRGFSTADSASLTDTPDRAIYEIDTISRLPFDVDRQRAYKAIARRSDLDEAVQTYLIQAVFDHLTFEAAKEDVLLTIIKNPRFNGKGRRAILGSIDRLVFENDREKIMRAIDRSKI
jgi:hypothetical protein